MNKHPLTIDGYVAFIREMSPHANEEHIRSYTEKLISGEYRLLAGHKPAILDVETSHEVAFFSDKDAFQFCRSVVEYQSLSSAQSVEQIIDLLELRGCSSEGNCRATILDAIQFGYEGCGEVITAKESGEYFNFTQVQADAIRTFIDRERANSRLQGVAPFDAKQAIGRTKRFYETLVAFAARVELSAGAYGDQRRANLVSFLSACIEDEKEPFKGDVTLRREPSKNWWGFMSRRLCAEAFAIVERERHIKRGVETHKFVEAQYIDRAIEEPRAGSQALVRTHAEVAAGSKSMYEEISKAQLEEPEAPHLTGLLRARAIVRAVTRKCDSAGVVDTAAILDDKLVALQRALAKTGAARSSDGEARVMRVVFEKDSPIPVSALPEIKNAIADEVLEHLPSQDANRPRELGEVLIAYANWVDALGHLNPRTAVSRIAPVEREVLRSDLGIEE